MEIAYLRTMSRTSPAPIHNYCDRWCERCFLTSKCGIYDKASLELDQNNEAFWKSIGDQLEQSIELLLEEARKRGIDLDNLDADDRAREQILETNRNHPAAKLSAHYAKSVFNWKQQNLSDPDEFPINGQHESPSLKNSLEVITWYEIFIHAKIMRALSGKFSEDRWPEDDGQHDYDGSAKIALIAIERSVKAWGIALKFIPGHALEIVSFIAMLEQLQNLLEQEFPEAWSFIRPGFDEG